MRLPWGASLANAWVRAPALVIALVLCIHGATFAHKPLFADSSATDPDAAVRIVDPTVSYVIYFELDEHRAAQWFVIENDRPREIPVQLGVPMGRAQEAAEIAVILFRPDSPGTPDSLNSAPEESPGAFELPRTDSPERFYEPVTGTESLILVDTQISLPSAGKYYGVVFNPPGEDARVWVAIGRREGFTWRDIVRLPGWIQRVRAFHDVPGWPRWVWIAAAGLSTVVAGTMIWVVRRRQGAA